eukprot:m.124226 g.124226  ORF g.124226 m.124226 type:complete len:271 (+) comp23413_c0_seq7:20-832(+)
MKYGQMIMGPAGSGKSTYCSLLAEHCEVINRTIHIINLDPAAEEFNYPVSWDVRDIISVDDVAEALHFGPNGGLIYCMEFLMKNIHVLDEALGDFDDDYLVFDCPGQIELYTHVPAMKQLVTHLQERDYRVAGVYLLDSQFIDDPSKYFSGVLSATSVMLQLQIPHINVLSKMDLAKHFRNTLDLESYLDPDTRTILQMINEETNPKRHSLNAAIATLIEDFSLVKFVPLDRTDEDSISTVLMHVDHCIQYGEDEEVKIPKQEDDEDEEA